MKYFIMVVLSVIIAMQIYIISDNSFKKPCIANYHSTTPPWFAKMDQTMLEDVEPFPSDSIFAGKYKNQNEFIKSVLENTETTVFVNEQNGKEFVVPSLCYVYDVDYWGDPILMRE